MVTAIGIVVFGLLLFSWSSIQQCLENEEHKEYSQFGSILVPKGRRRAEQRMKTADERRYWYEKHENPVVFNLLMHFQSRIWNA